MSNELKVLSVVLVIWAGLFFYLLHIDRQVKNLKNRDS
jgi:CcmD family protein